MPFTLLAHQAPVLPLKLLRPSWFSGTALVIGSIAPDLEYVVHNEPKLNTSTFAHSLLGQFVLCLPLTVVITVLAQRTNAIGAIGARFGVDLFERSSALPRIAGSALIGSFSHIGLDAIARWVVPHFAFFTWGRGSFVIGAGSIVQLVLTVVLSLVTVVLARRMLARMTMRSDGRPLLVCSASMAIAVGLVRSRTAIENPGAFFDAAPIYVWGFVLLQITTCVAVAWLVVGFLLWRRDATKVTATMKEE
jgi:hypothetical protein